jgi:muramoyltetrapeptide carboxypeptidase
VRAEEAVRPPALQPGDLVAVVSPSGPARPELVATGASLLRSWGLRPVPAAHAFDRHAYLAGTDADRVADLNAALADPEVRGIVVTRGGYGLQRIADRIDLAAVRRDPKPVAGFSDTTALHLALWRGARLASVYGPGAAWRAERTSAVSAQSLRDALMSADRVVVKQEPAAPSTPASRLGPPGRSGSTGLPGVVTGRLLGGNLSLLASTLGSYDFPDLTGAILLIEEVGEPPYKVDRMLTQLRRSGALAGLAGVAVGQFVRCTDEWSTDIADVLDDRLRDLAVPVLGGLPVGHGPDQLAVPLGVPAMLDVPAATLTVSPAVR